MSGRMIGVAMSHRPVVIVSDRCAFTTVRHLVEAIAMDASSHPDTTAAARIAGYTTIPAAPTAAQVATETSQAAHRLDVVRAWRIPPGSRLLEIGCGQGTCTAVLAEIVGPTGWIDAVDPGPPDYGTPFTLGQSQTHISRSAVGDRIAWHHADPIAFLEQSETWDAAVLVHCAWYFDRPEVLRQMLQRLTGRVQRVLIAEYALHASDKHAMPHLLASIARATKEAHDPTSQANIRCLLGPAQIVDAAAAAGWILEQETTIVPRSDLQDGAWETAKVTRAKFLEIPDQPRVTALLTSLQEAVLSAVQLASEPVRTMDVWAASFT